MASRGKRHYGGSRNRYNKDVRLREYESREEEQEEDDKIATSDELDEGIMDNKTSNLGVSLGSLMEAKLVQNEEKWYVLNTNLILACVDVLYDSGDEEWRPPLNFHPNLDKAHLIIPSVVFEELNHIKDEHSVNSAIARVAFRRLLNYIPNSGRSLDDIMNLKKPISTGWKEQKISILPLHRDFAKSLPWVPESTDYDGWIAVTALAATMIKEKLPVDGTICTRDILKRHNGCSDVILLTGDNALMSKADQFGVRAMAYSFEKRPPFTGRRDLVVPAEMFAKFYHEEHLARKEFERYLPEQPPLVDNEYIVMTPEDDIYPRSYFVTDTMFANIARYNKKNDALFPLRFMKYEGVVPPNAGIATYYDALNDNNIDVIVVTGRAGTGKTFQAIIHALHAVESGKYIGVKLIIDPDNGIGFLPGGLERKVEPMVAFCKDAIRSYLSRKPEFQKKRELLRKYGETEAASGRDGVNDDDYSTHPAKKKGRKNKDITRNYGFEGLSYTDEDYLYDYPMDNYEDAPNDKKMRSNKPKKSSEASLKTYGELLNEQVDYIYKRHFEAIPYMQARSRSFEDYIVIIDEAQRIVIDDMETFITRPARNSLLIVCGDVNQIRYNSLEKRLKNGLIFTRKIYYDWEGCANIHLTDNMRHRAVDVANRNYDKVMKEVGSLRT